MDSEPKARRTDPAKDVRGDSATFVEFARKLVAVPHTEIKAEMEAEKAWKHWPNVSPPSVSRVSGAGSKRGR